jgi:hypothetical protein
MNLYSAKFSTLCTYYVIYYTDLLSGDRTVARVGATGRGEGVDMIFTTPVWYSIFCE